MARPRGTCRICGRNVAELTFEHVAPRAALNNEQTRVYGIDDWMRRGDDGLLTAGRVEQRGAGDYTLCADCNNKTGSWYGTELRRAAKSAGRILRQLPLDELDAKLEPTWASESANITGAVDVGYNQPADLEMDLLIGFGHTPYPADYRTRALVERERALNEADG